MILEYYYLPLRKKLRANSNPTILQVAADAILHLLLSLEEPDKGLYMQNEFDSQKTLKSAKPFSGTIY